MGHRRFGPAIGKHSGSEEYKDRENSDEKSVALAHKRLPKIIGRAGPILHGGPLSLRRSPSGEIDDAYRGCDRPRLKVLLTNVNFRRIFQSSNAKGNG